MTYALATLGAVMYFVGYAGFGVWPLAFGCLVPLWLALERSLEHRSRQTFLLGWFYGTVTYVGGYHWLVSMLEVFSGYGLIPSILFTVIVCAYFGLQFGIYAWIYRRLRKRGWSAVTVAIPPLLVVESYYPLLFPSYLANSLFEQTTFVQILDLGGPVLLTAVIACVNLLLYTLVRWRQGTRAFPAAITALAAVLAVSTYVYGVYRIPQVEAAMAEAPKLRVGLVQVNMGIFEKRKDATEGLRRHVEQTKELHQEHELDLVVWPESAYMRRLPRTLPIDGKDVIDEVKAPILFGGTSVAYPEGRRRLYNTAFMLGRDRTIRTVYDKTFLLMFGEYLPFGDKIPKLYDLSPNSGKFTQGTLVQPLLMDDWRISVPICYEDVDPRHTRKLIMASDPHLMVNITNDAWFGNTQEPWIHLALSQYRAVEHRRYLIRSTNSGVSAFVDPLGRVVSKTGLQTRENLVSEVSMLTRKTLFTRLGNWPGMFSLAFVAFAAFFRRR